MEFNFGDAQLGNLLFIFLYFLPALVGFLRQRADPNRKIPVGVVFVLDLFFAWTIIGWIVAMAIAWRGEEFGTEASDPAPTGGWQPTAQAWEPQDWPGPQPIANSWQQPEEPGPCLRCQDRGETCPSCFGNRGKYERPAGENGVDTWHPCTYCCGNGRVQCTWCGKIQYGV